MRTNESSGLAVWCNSCQDFPDDYRLTVMGKMPSNLTTKLVCKDCGEEMEL